MSTAATDIYYDPYDFAIDQNPYPVWTRMREEMPLYYNERYDFYALSRYADVEEASVDWQTYTSSKGILMEMVKAGIPTPPGLCIAEDPPQHDMHRLILSRAVTPRRVQVLETRIRELRGVPGPARRQRPVRPDAGLRQSPADAGHRCPGRHPRRVPAEPS